MPIFHANKARIRHKQEDEQANQASCLNLVTNAVIAWNTVYIAAVLEQLKREGHPVNKDDLQRLCPTRFEHINVHGRIVFDLEEALNRQGLRPLWFP